MTVDLKKGLIKQANWKIKDSIYYPNGQLVAKLKPSIHLGIELRKDRR